MQLSSKLNVEGWDIRYSILESTKDSQEIRDVCFVHGTPWSSIVYEPIIEALLARNSYRIPVYDLPGYGLSQTYNNESKVTQADGDFIGDTSVKFQAKAFSTLLAHLQDISGNWKSPAVIAHDIAGAIVLRAHLLHKYDYHSMMLLDTNAVLPWGDGFYSLARSESQVFMRLPPKTYETVLRGVVQSAFHNPRICQTGWEDALVKPWLDDSSEKPGDRQYSFVRQIAQANDADVAEMLDNDMYEQVRCDVKIVWGQEDQSIPGTKMVELARRLKDKIKEYVTVPNAGHLVMLEQSARVAIDFYDWLSRP